MSNIKLEQCVVVEKGRYEIDPETMVVIDLKARRCTQPLSPGAIEDVIARMTGMNELIFDRPYPPTEGN